MNKELHNLIEDYKKTDWNSLLRKNMGDYHLKELKPHLDFIRNFFNELISDLHFESSYQPYTVLLNQCFNRFRLIKESIKAYRDGGQKQRIIDQVINYKQEVFQNLGPLFNMLKIQTEYHPDRCTDHPEKVVGKYNRSIKEIEQELKKLRQLQSHYSEQTVRVEASRYGDFFKKEAEQNKKSSWFFGVLFFGLSLLAGWFAYCFLRFDQEIEADTFAELLIKGDVINKVFIFSVTLFVISLIRREYLALRHQFTLNTHRHNALSSHKEILSSIEKTASESDKEISNAVLLELTKSMFSPQDTGFVKNQAAVSSGNRIVEISKSLFSDPKE